MGSEKIRKDLQEFERAVVSLSESVRQSSVLWRDRQYSELSLSVSQIANQSKDVLSIGDKCCSCIEKFNSIAAETY